MTDLTQEFEGMAVPKAAAKNAEENLRLEISAQGFDLFKQVYAAHLAAWRNTAINVADKLKQITPELLDSVGQNDLSAYLCARLSDAQNSAKAIDAAYEAITRNLDVVDISNSLSSVVDGVNYLSPKKQEAVQFLILAESLCGDEKQDAYLMLAEYSNFVHVVMGAVTDIENEILDVLDKYPEGTFDKIKSNIVRMGAKYHPTVASDWKSLAKLSSERLSLITLNREHS